MNKNVFITGISSGIGLSLAKEFLNQGYYVMGTTRTGILNEFAHEHLSIVELDLKSQKSRDAVAGFLLKNNIKLDILVNNAGIAPDVFDSSPDLSSFNDTIETNLTGTLFFTENLIDFVCDSGKVVFISSEMGRFEKAGETGVAYCVSKGGLNMYAAILARRLEKRGITVTPLHPGWVRTKLGGEQAPLSPSRAAKRIISSLALLQNGQFFNTDFLAD